MIPDQQGHGLPIDLSKLPVLNGREENGGLHAVDRRLGLVWCVTDSLGGAALANAFAQESIRGGVPLLLVGTSELPLYADYKRLALVDTPERRVCKAFQHWGKQHPEEMLGADVNTFAMEHVPVPGDADILPWQTYLLKQSHMLCVNGVAEVDIMLGMWEAHRWLPYLQRRFNLPPLAFYETPMLGPELRGRAKAHIAKVYADDLTLLEPMQGASLWVV